MGSLYLGKLDYRDPLFEVLSSCACPDARDPVFHVHHMAKWRVYKYSEEKTGVAIIGKFFRIDDAKAERVLRIRGEYDNLRALRARGFDAAPNCVVRPIGKEERIGLALIEEFVSGRNLDHFICRAVYGGEADGLRRALERLASFLYALHTKTATGLSVSTDYICAYFRKVLEKLLGQEVIPPREKKTYLKLLDRWLERPLISRSGCVTVHGDATPTNFIFTDAGAVVAIDLERMKSADGALDVGMVCAELKHAFMWRAGNRFLAEPFIGHFLRSYAGHFADARRAFRQLTRRTPLYMAIAELRIARNDWLERGYRKRLAHEALKCLKWGLEIR